MSKPRSLLSLGVVAAIALLFTGAPTPCEAGPPRGYVSPHYSSARPYAPPNVYVAQSMATQQAMVRAMLYQQALRQQYLYQRFYVWPRLNGAISPYPSIGGGGCRNGSDSGGD
jgi:hypothetical protein